MDTTTNTIDGQTVKGAGDPACRLCGGTGGTWRQDGVYLLGGSCACARSRQWEDAIRRCWPADIRRAAEMAPSASVLTGKTSMNVWVRAERDVLAAHLAVALPATGRIELVRIASDADLAVAWLARVGDKVRDDEVREAMSRDEEDRFDRLVDLVAPPALLVIQLGVRLSPLSHLPDLVLEAIEIRRQRGRATWVVDTDVRPICTDHRAYREDLVDVLAAWTQVRLPSAQEVGEVANLAVTAAKAAPRRRPDPELLEEAERDGWTPKNVGRHGSLWGDCPGCGGVDCYGYIKNGLDRINKYCKACKGKASPPAAPPPVAPPPAAPPPAVKKTSTAREALRNALGIGGSTPIPVCPAELEAAGYSKSSLEKALKDLRRDHEIKAQRQGDRWVWLWAP